MRLALLTTGLRPLGLAFATLPGVPVGVVRWDGEGAIGAGGGLRERPLARAAIARLRGRPYASLAHLAAANGLAYAEIVKSDPDALARTLADWRVDLVVTSGCPLVPMSALERVRHGGINLHPSLLPAYRGADPLLWQVVDGVAETGASVHRLAAGSDTGAVLGSRSIARPRAVTRDALTAATEGELGVPLVRRVVADIAAGRARPVEQPDASPTRYARRMPPAELACRVPLAGLDPDALEDITRFLGACPVGWLGLEGWRSALRWVPRHSSVAREARGADRDGWRVLDRGLLMGLRRGPRTLWFGPLSGDLRRTAR